MPAVAHFMAAELSALVNRVTVEAHVDEAAFLWEHRERAATAPHYRLHHLRPLDERLVAHLDGARLGGAFASRVAAAALEGGEAGAVFVTTHLAFAESDPARMRQMLGLVLAEPAHAAPFVAALAWLPAAHVAPALERLEATSRPDARGLALAVQGAQRTAPRADTLAAALAHPDAPHLRSTALRVAGQVGATEVHAAVARAAHDDPVPACRFWAAWALTLFGDPLGPTRLLSAGLGDPAFARTGVEVALRCGAPDWAHDQVRRLIADPATRRLGIVGIGACGDPVAIPWLLAQLDDPLLAPVAGEAFATITGADLEHLDLRADAPEATDDLPPEDNDLPWPDAKAVRTWWPAQAVRFSPGLRHLCGRPLDAAAATAVLRDGGQRQREAAAIELAAGQGAAPLFPVFDRADRQMQRLAT